VTSEQRKAIDKREAAVLACLQSGMANREIADKLKIPIHIVAKDVSVLLQRYNAKNRVSLVVNLWKVGQDKLGAR